MFFKDYPTKHTVMHDGRRKRVYERVYEDCMGGGTRLITKRTNRDMERIRKRYYNGARIGVQTWSKVHEGEIEADQERKAYERKLRQPCKR